ncbi:electron transport complex subunit RsxC [Halothiobacillus sp. DCM-1]|uniref:electron transport complex subunit RsxC n=1 Tax=Halothiobacillus sp. DCM-1 TaxID=3112558 RepID=UPI00324AB869
MPESRPIVQAPHRFHGGIHPPEQKAMTRDRPIRDMPLQARYVLPLQMHIGEPARPVVQVGETVRRGQLLAQATDFVSASVHAPTSGLIAAIDEQPIPHPGGLSSRCITLIADGADTPAQDLEPWPEYAQRSALELRTRLREAGIVGLGGAVFPTPAKLATDGKTPVHTLVLNGAECEPYISCDDRLMRENPQEILEGARIILHLMGADRCLIGIEDNKPEAQHRLHQAAADDARFTVVSVPTRYPAGGEKQLLKVLTGIEVPRGKRATQYGLLCLNVATVAAVYRAVVHGEPMIDRIVTVTGGGIVQPENFRVRLGTLMSAVVAEAGGYTQGTDRLLMGGPMMGFALRDDEVPVVKATNCLLALRPQDRPAEPPPAPCIRCSLCADACPADLLPQQLYWHARARAFERAVDHHLFDCIECGVCSAVCPSHLPLVDYFRFAKTEVWAAEREKSKAQTAKQRFEFRNERLARIKAEREAALAKKREALARNTAASDDTVGRYEPNPVPEASADAAVEAARARAKARRALLAAERAQSTPQAQEQNQEPPL